MAMLQRSGVSFRRQGSSGLVWDEKSFSEELYQTLGQHTRDEAEYRELRPCQSAKGIGMMDFVGRTVTGRTVCPRSLSSSAMTNPPPSTKRRFLKMLPAFLAKSKSIIEHHSP